MKPGREETLKRLMDKVIKTTGGRKMNKIIKDIEILENKLFLRLEDNICLKFVDRGQSCCEKRYMSTDENLEQFIGSKYLGYEVKSAKHGTADFDIHEIQFLIINTNLGDITISNHNIHNGYYGGFDLQVIQMEITKHSPQCCGS